jgi:hypothetical protein
MKKRIALVVGSTGLLVLLVAGVAFAMTITGTYDGKTLMTQLKALSVILLRSGAVQETNGRHYITVRVDSFVRIEQVAVELVAKTLQPWIAKTADQNFIETLTFVSNFSRTAEKNPHGIERLAADYPDVWVMLLHVNPATGRLTVDRHLRDAGAHVRREEARVLVLHRVELERDLVRADRRIAEPRRKQEGNVVFQVFNRLFG